MCNPCIHRPIKAATADREVHSEHRTNAKVGTSVSSFHLTTRQWHFQSLKRQNPPSLEVSYGAVDTNQPRRKNARPRTADRG